MKRFVLGIALLAVVGILIWQIVKHINEPNSKLLTDLYYKYVPTWHRV